MAFKISDIENNISDLWEEKNIFRKSLIKNKDCPNFTFYDGPPFATGNPHYGHILAGAIKDTICRNAQFNGYNVERRAGWDPHGLPIEYEIEKELGIKNYQQILDYGIKNYNDECRKIVLRCADYWKTFMTRFGKWIDFDNDYKTMDFDFMQSVWTVFKEMWDKKLVYQGFKVMPYSTACGTPLSNFEANSNYKSVNEESIIVKFKAKDEDLYYLVWTTTPWTLPSNMLLCVNAEYNYSTYELNGEKYIVCDTLVKEVFGNGKRKKLPSDLKKINTFKGIELKDKEYIPVFNFYNDQSNKIVVDSYVKDSSGTGIVHIAPAFGEDDFRISINNGIITPYGDGMRCPVDRNGCFTEPLPDIFINKNVKECDKEFIDILKQDNFLFKRLNITHEYPYCWRSDTPLIYKATPSWFVEVTKIKDKMLENCQNTNWVPDHIKSKRFNNWLLEAKDWGISRNRVWGTPIPIWTDGKEYICVGSASELEKLAKLEPESITDIHRENIDDIEIISPKTGNKLRRVEFVFDCWFESGSMPFASQNYHKNKDINYPAEFIAEGLDQTRGWFYTLLIIGTALKNQAPFKNVIVNGLVLAEDGKKMSKRLKNYPDPQLIINQYGSDALRLYLLSSPAVRAEGLRFKEDGVKDILRSVLIPLQNSYNFYNVHTTKMSKFSGKKIQFDNTISDNIFDKWIIFKFNEYKKLILDDLNNYNLHRLHRETVTFIENLNNVYIKLNRERLKGNIDQLSYYDSQRTLGLVLYNFAILCTSYLPFFSEHLYTKLKDDFINTSSESVHLLSYSDTTITDISHQIEFSKIDYLIEVINLIRMYRGREGFNDKIPFNDIKICSPKNIAIQLLNSFEEYILNEGNVLDIKFDDINSFSQISYLPNISLIGKVYKQKSGDVKQYISLLDNSDIETKLKTNTLEFNLSHEHFIINRNIKKFKNYENVVNENNSIILYINSTQNEITTKKYISKLLATSIQKLRKEKKLQPWNKIYVNLKCDNIKITNAYLENKDYICEIIRYPVYMNKKINVNVKYNTTVSILDNSVGIDIYE